MPSGKVPRCPAELTPDAKRVWKRVVPAIVDMVTVGTGDLEALAQYCQNVARWWEDQQFCTEHGSYYPVRDAKGNVVGLEECPQSKRMDRLARSLRKDERLFGMDENTRATLLLSRGHTTSIEPGQDELPKCDQLLYRTCSADGRPRP